MRFKIFFVILLIFISASLTYAADPYWVDDDGTETTWANCQSASPLSGNSCCDMTTANSNADAGDTIYLRAGSYPVPIKPIHSGTLANRITWEAYNSESVIFTCDTLVSYLFYPGIYLNGVDYNVIRGVEVDCNNNDHRYVLYMDFGADYNEIDNCTLHGGGRYDDVLATKDQGNSGIHIKDSNGTIGSNYNWIHDCVIYDAGYIDNESCDDKSNLIKLANLGQDYVSHDNTIEDCILYGGGHHLIQSFGPNNVIRNNIMHNEGWMDHSTCDPEVNGYPPDDNGLWGNRCVELSDKNNRTNIRNLFEGNRLGHSGPPPDGNGAIGVEVSSSANIIRYNSAFNSGEKGFSLYSKASSLANHNRVYNNTSYITRGLRVAPDGFFCANPDYDNALKNNISYLSSRRDIGLMCDDGSNDVANNWTTADGDPLFVNTNISDKTSLTLPNLALNSGSGCIDTGTYLTQANGAGSNSTTLIVDDATYFQDGSMGSPLANIQADYIAIGTVSNTVQISSISYPYTITLESPMTWSDNANIWLYKKSDGVIVLKGSAPDRGAYEYGGATLSGILQADNILEDDVVAGGGAWTITVTVVNTTVVDSSAAKDALLAIFDGPDEFDTCWATVDNSMVAVNGTTQYIITPDACPAFDIDDTITVDVGDIPAACTASAQAITPVPNEFYIGYIAPEPPPASPGKLILFGVGPTGIYDSAGVAIVQ